jgi:hypothetical protein
MPSLLSHSSNRCLRPALLRIDDDVPALLASIRRTASFDKRDVYPSSGFALQQAILMLPLTLASGQRSFAALNMIVCSFNSLRAVWLAPPFKFSRSVLRPIQKFCVDHVH